MVSVRRRRLCAAFAICLAAAAPARAALSQQHAATSDLTLSEDSVLLPPPPPGRLELYRASFSALDVAQKMNIAIHGIRLAALHPGVWEVRRIDRTENRNIVPIRPFYLRAAEERSFELSALDLRLTFKPAKVAHMLKFRDQKTAVLDIEFGGEYVKGPAGERDLRDNAYVARISATPLLQSGIYYRSYTAYAALAPAGTGRIEAGRSYHVQLRTAADHAALLLDGAEAARIPGDHRRGLVSLAVCWHPLALADLEVRGTVEKNGERLPFLESGLVRIEQ